MIYTLACKENASNDFSTLYANALYARSVQAIDFNPLDNATTELTKYNAKAFLFT